MRRLVTGFLALIGAAVVLLIVAGAALWYVARPSTPGVPDAAILALDLTSAYAEAPPANELAGLLVEERPTLRQVVDALGRAGDDPRVKGIIARLGDGELGFAQIQELRDAIARFRAKGKPAVAYADTFGELGSGTRGYYLASACDEIWLQPLGTLGLVGLRAEVPFFRGTLDWLGIEPRFERREEYKTAMNILTESAMTPPHREETESLLRSLYGQLVRGIAADRRLDEGEVRAIVDRGPLTTKEALDAKLIDHAGYRDEAIAAARRRSGGGRIVSLRHYIDGVGEAHRQGPAIALIHASGLIQRGRSSENPLSGGGFVGADTLARAFRDAARDKDIRAILFRIDSRGGSAVASETIWRATQEARRAGKPIVVSMGDIAGSGGYYIAAGADKIVAEPATLTGSIGVVAGKILVEGLMRKLGASWDGVEVGANAGIASSLQDFSPAGRARFEAILDEVYGGFKDRVAEGRKLGGDAVEAVAKGRVWTGEDAKAKGLVDELGGYDKALLLAKQAAGIPGDQEVTLKQFPEPGAATEALLARLLGRDREPDEGAQMTASGGGALGALRPMWQAIEAAVGPAGMLTMPPIMVR